MKKQILLAGALCASMLASAENIDVKSFRYVGPYQVHQPYLVDSVDVNSKAFAMKNLLDTPLALEQLGEGTSFQGETLPNVNEGYALHLLGFTLQSSAYTEAELKIEGVKAEVTLEPPVATVEWEGPPLPIEELQKILIEKGGDYQISE